MRRSALFLLTAGLLLAPLYVRPSIGLLDRRGDEAAAPIPEPGTFILVGCGLMLLAMLLRRRRRVSLVG